MNSLYSELIKVFKALSKIEKLNFVKDQAVEISCHAGQLLNIKTDLLTSPVDHLLESISSKKSPLSDQSPDYPVLEQLISELEKAQAIKELNHVGFCYHVDAQDTERAKLLSETKDTTFKLYEEATDDIAKWYFVGDTSTWEDPMIELLPVESKNETFIDYWLPHIHIDIDTTFTEEEIENLIYRLYEGDPKPIRITVIDGVVYTIRLRLGVLDGVNLFLDLSTKNRMVEFSRKNILKQIS
jgi:hypothetical protein